VLGLRFFICDGCDTVYADVETPPRCRYCEDGSVERVEPESQAADYFTGREPVSRLETGR